MEEVKKGTFFSVGVGPGDPELITLKGVRILKTCPVIAAPRTKNGDMLAFEIAKQVIDCTHKIILPIDISMERGGSRRQQDYEQGVATIAQHLSAGQDVAMMNLGDVSIYATSGYMMEMLAERGFETVMVPGVPSFCAVAAKLNCSLTTQNAPLHIFPAGSTPLEEALDAAGTKVLMKSGRQLPKVIEQLERKGLLERAALVQNCGLPGERVCHDLRADVEAGYFSTIIIKE